MSIVMGLGGSIATQSLPIFVKMAKLGHFLSRISMFILFDRDNNVIYDVLLA
jgi:hypothetical protein